MAKLVKVAKVSELPPGSKLLTVVDDQPAALFNVNGMIYAIEDVCTHDGGLLAEGEVDGYEIECPRHGARFDIRIGRALRMPAFEPVKAYDVIVEGDDILITVG